MPAPASVERDIITAERLLGVLGADRPRFPFNCQTDASITRIPGAVWSFGKSFFPQADPEIAVVERHFVILITPIL